MLDSDQTNLRDMLSDPSLLETRGWVDGAWIEADSGASFAVTNPARNDVIAEVTDLGRAETARAIASAEAAQKDWAARTAKDRATVLRAWHGLMLEHAEDLALILTAEMGKPLGEAKGEVAYGASFVEWYAEEARRVYGETVPGHEPDKRVTVIRQPVGVAGAITPWNFPNAMITRKAAPALAAGCAFIVKPSDETPLSALALGVLAERAGIPGGVFQIIPAKDAAAIGQEFCDNPGMRKLSFTGSTAVGRILLRQAADQVMNCSMELGGNAPFLVFDDADLDAAVEGAMASKYRNAGQTCVCANRIYVQAGVYDAFAEKLGQAIAALKVGDGFADGVTIGPLINAKAVEKVEDHIEDARSKGAEILMGGSAHALGGTFYEPTLVSGVTQEMKIASEETFGPVAPLFRFEDEAEGIALANATEFGLAAYFYASDVGRVTRVSEALEYGIVGVNTGIISTESVPFGGVKQSGLGREGGWQGIDEYLETKYICLSV